MPFTPSHAAILLPIKWIKKIPVSWTALVIGSMIPDGEYFFWLKSGSFYSHTLTGMFWFDLPLTIIMAFIWHSYLRNSIVEKLPVLKDKFKIYTDFNFNLYLRQNFLIFIYSALVGILSHLLWDSFCHGNGYMVQRIPALLIQTKIFGFKLRWCYVVWYISSLIGLIIVINESITFNRSWKEMIRLIPVKYIFWVNVFWFTVSIFLTRCMIGVDDNVQRHLIIIAIGAFMYAFLIASIIEKRATKLIR